ncbi:MAG: hypothetical protein Q4P32_13260 [Micrococcales bacterium]|nr:hypothetical protein [Micrococcales bacterium]
MTAMNATLDPGASRHIALGPHALAQRVPCTICHAGTSEPCLESDGTERADPHHSRWIRYQHLMRQRPFTAILREPVDERLAVGDVLLCVATPEARTLRVLTDGMGHRQGPETVDARAVEFCAFIEETARRAMPRRGARSRSQRRGTA